MPRKRKEAEENKTLKEVPQEEVFHNPTIRDKHVIPAANAFYGTEYVWTTLPEGYGLPEGVTYSFAYLETMGLLLVLGGVPAIKNVVNKVVAMLDEVNPDLKFQHSLGAGSISGTRIRKFVQGQNAIENYKWEQSQRELLDNQNLSRVISQADRKKLLAQSPSDRELTTGDDSPNIQLWYAVFGLSNGWLRHTREVSRIQIMSDENRELFLKPGSMKRLEQALKEGEKVTGKKLQSKIEPLPPSALGDDNAGENDQDRDDLNREDTLAQE